LGKSIYSALYRPPLNSPIRTIDLPIAGLGYGTQTLPLVFDLVNIANKLVVVDASKKKKEKLEVAQEKPNEAETLTVLRNTQKLINRFTGTEPSSLGLHPAVYFYSSNGRHQGTSVLAIASLLMDIEDRLGFLDFTRVRGEFETFLLNHKMFVNQLTVKHGSMAKGFRPLKDYYSFVLDQFLAGKQAAEVEGILSLHDRYQTLVRERPTVSKKAKDFSQNTKQVVFIETALEKAIVCSICHARIDSKAMHFDHKVDKSKGGLGEGANAQMVHPYCDSTYKPFLGTV
jgi:hypothetical protein